MNRFCQALITSKETFNNHPVDSHASSNLCNRAIRVGADLVPDLSLIRAIRVIRENPRFRQSATIVHFTTPLPTAESERSERPYC